MKNNHNLFERIVHEYFWLALYYVCASVYSKYKIQSIEFPRGIVRLTVEWFGDEKTIVVSRDTALFDGRQNDG